MQTIEHYYQMVETIISKLGVDPAICRGEEPGEWNLKKGSSNVWVNVWKVQDQDYGYIQVMGPITQIPVENRDIFMTEVLEINHTLYGVAFSKYKEWLYIRAIRELDGLDEHEANSMFTRIGNYADEYDNYFKNKYFSGSGERPTQ
ncbi:MAG: YbjN domain-containing protein [Bacteroidales bacterium]|nr:YbjN domain-containing protein [Bacteroidales bacterium]